MGDLVSIDTCQQVGSNLGLALEATSVCHSFSNAESGLVLDHIDLSVSAGEFVSIVGPSGCGKTTFLNLVGGLEQLQKGSLSVRGSAPSAGAAGVGYVFARDAILPWRTAAQNVALPLELAGVPKDERDDRVHRLLAAVGLADFAGAYRAQLSQGMRQRVALARALVSAPSLLLMDEPFAALDAQTRIVMQDYLLNLLSTHQITVLFVTHDLGETITLSDRVVVFSRRPGRIKAVFDIDLPRPRSVMALQADPKYHSLYERIWLELRDEVLAASS